MNKFTTPANARGLYKPRSRKIIMEERAQKAYDKAFRATAFHYGFENKVNDERIEEICKAAGNEAYNYFLKENT